MNCIINCELNPILQFFENLGIFGTNVSLEVYLALLLPILILLQCIRDIKYLALPSTLANIMQLAGMSIIVYNLVQGLAPVGERTMVGSKFPLFFVTTIFNFEGISIVITNIINIRNDQGVLGGIFRITTLVIPDQY